MRISRVLIIYKKNVGRSHVNAYETHHASLRNVEKLLRTAGISFKKMPRGSYFKEEDFDLILSVGGDGTFLDAARHIQKKLLLGLNSDAHHSVGRFCADYATRFSRVLARVRRDDFQVRSIERMKVSLNGKAVKTPLLNDVLICHASPAAMNHYVLKLGRRSERQRSSGVWISTAAGSSAAIRSAGGKALAFGSKNFQYKPRELFDGHGVRYVLRGGVFDPSKPLTIVSQMEDALIYMDGPHHSLGFHYGDKVRISRSQHPLKAIYFTGKGGRS